MATDTADLATPHARTRTAPDPARHAWQVPTFLLGAVVFVSAWQGWLPLGTPDPGAAFARDLDALRTCTERVTPDREELKDLLSRVAAGVDAYPEYAPPARFALGSGYARLAELTPVPDEARAHWTLAKQHFELVKGELLKDPSDPPKLAFRFAKAKAAIGLPTGTPVPDVRLLITVLGNVPFGEEPGEAGRLQADLAMRLVPPDVGTAKDSLTRYLTATGIATPPASLSRAKLMLGEIHLRREEPALARKWLEQIGVDSPPELVAGSRALLARVRMKEDDWAGAVRDWESVMASAAVPSAQKAAYAYHLGWCKVHTREPGDAARRFEEAAKGDGPEARAAGVRLADLLFKGDDKARRPAAVDHLARAVNGMKAPADWRNPFVRIGDVRAAFEYGIATLLKDGAYDAAVRAADGYAGVCEPGREREKRAESLAAWAEALQKSGGDFKLKAAAAAKEYESLTAIQPAASAKADILRRAAGLHKLAGDPAAAVVALQTATQLPQLPPAAAGAVWVDLADALVATNRPAKEVIDAFNQAIAAGGPVSTATRYTLASKFADARDPRLAPLARALFEQIANQEDIGADERESHERALVELAREYIRANDYPKAEVWLRKQIGIYPTGPEAPLGRLLLGVCLLQRATAKPPVVPSAPDAATAARYRDEAVKLFKQVVADADVKQRRDGTLGDRDAWARVQAGLRVLQTYQQMEKPNDLLAEAKEMLDRHRGTVEELIVLSLVFHAFKQKKETGKALETRDKMKELFDRLPPGAFPNKSGEYSREYWEKVWFAPEPK